MPDQTTPRTEPLVIVAGETLKWLKALADYPATEWALTYSFRGVGAGFDAAAEADGDAHLVTVSAETTAALAAGAYFWQAWAAKGAEKHMVDSGRAAVKQSLAAVAAETPVDDRSLVKKTLDAIDARIQGRVTADVQSYQIGNGGSARQLMKIPMNELLDLRKYYAGLYAQERRRERARRGKPFFRQITVRFDES